MHIVLEKRLCGRKQSEASTMKRLLKTFLFDLKQIIALKSAGVGEEDNPHLQPKRFQLILTFCSTLDKSCFEAYGPK